MPLPPGDVAYTDIAYLTTVYRGFHGLHSFLDGHACIGPVDLVQIKNLDAQETQAGVSGTEDLVVAQVLARNHGGDKHPLTYTLDRLSHDIFGTIDFRCVDEVRPEFNPTSQRLDTATIFPGTEPNFWHHHISIAQLFQFDHGLVSTARGGSRGGELIRINRNFDHGRLATLERRLHRIADLVRMLDVIALGA